MTATVRAEEKAVRRSRTVAAATTLGVVIGLTWVGVALQMRSAGTARLELLRDLFEYRQGQVANAAPLKMQHQELALVLQDMTQRLPSRLDAERIPRDLRMLADELGVELTRAVAGVEVRKEFYAELGVDVGLRGPRAAVYRFLQRLTHQESTNLVRELELTAASDNAALEAAVLVVYFRYIDDEEYEELNDGDAS